MSVVLIVIVIAAALLLWPGTPRLFPTALKFLQPYDNAMFRARDVYRDASQTMGRRFFYGAVYAIMIGVPLTLFTLVIAFAAFGKLIAPFTNAILGKP